MATRKNPAAPALTHAEILTLAIHQAYERYKEYADKAKPGMPEETLNIIESVAAPWREKILVLLQLYTIETGSDFGLDLDLGGGGSPAAPSA